MDTRENPYIDNLMKRLDEQSLSTSLDMARMMPLYIKVMNDNGVVRNVSFAYIDSYDGRSMYRKYGRHFDRMHEMFVRNGVDEPTRRKVFKRVAKNVMVAPRTAAEMKNMVSMVISETKEVLRLDRLAKSRAGLLERFRTSVWKYLNLAYTLGYNEPSACAAMLVDRHLLDKYVMSGEFPLLILPFLPDLESRIRRAYEHYEMVDAWDVLKGRYYNHLPEYHNMALEIKASFKHPVSNFSDYFDRIYTDTYYAMMLGKKGGGKGRNASEEERDNGSKGS